MILLRELLRHRLGIDSPTGTERFPDRNFLAPSVHDARTAAGATAGLGVSTLLVHVTQGVGLGDRARGSEARTVAPCTLQM